MNKIGKPYFFAVDLGATSGRTIVGHLDEGQIKLEEVTRFPNNLIEQVKTQLQRTPRPLPTMKINPEVKDIFGFKFDDFTLEITLNAPCPFFISLLPAQVFAALRPEIAPEKDSEWSNTVGYPTTGAFYPTKIDSADEYILEKNPNFAHADQVYYDRLVAKIMPSMEASMMAFKTGEIDYDTGADSSVVNDPELKDAIDIHGNINYYMNINMYDSNPALQDVRVRRAIQLGIDRSAFVTALDAGEVYYELYGFLPVGIPDFEGDFRTNADNDRILLQPERYA